MGLQNNKNQQELQKKPNNGRQLAVATGWCVTCKLNTAAV